MEELPEVEEAIKRDERDLWTAVLYLGETVDEYDLELDAFLPRFRRNEDWKAAVNAIRKLLKKYHTHERLPMRTAMAGWNVMGDRILPMVLRYNADTDFLYNMGKVLVYMTAMPNPRQVRSSVVSSSVVAHLRQYKQLLNRQPDFLRNFLILLLPALDTSQMEKTEKDINSVDLVLTLLKQLLEIPNASAATAAAMSSATGLAFTTVSEKFILQLHENGVYDAIVDISRLLDRREFRKLCLVLLDLWYQTAKCYTGDVLHKAHVKVSAAETDKARQAVSTTRVSTNASATSGSGSASTSAGVTTPAAPRAQASFGTGSAPNASGVGAKKIAMPRPASSGEPDLLAIAWQQERAALGAQRAAVGMTRHSRFGGNFMVQAPMGNSRLTSKPTLSADSVDSQVALKKQRTAPARNPRSRDLYQAPITIDLPDHGAARAAAAAGLAHGASSSAAAVAAVLQRGLENSGVAEQTKAVVYQIMMSLLRADAPESAPRRGQVIGADGSVTLDVADADAEDDDDAPAGVTAFHCLSEALKNKFIREADDATPEDRLRYFHFATTVMSLHRLTLLADIRKWEDEQKKASGSAAARGESGGGARMGAPASARPLGDSPGESSTQEASSAPTRPKPVYDVEPVKSCLDRWSFNFVLTSCDAYITRKQWQAVSVATAHLKELILTVHTMLEHGDAESRDIGGKLYDAVFREREVADMVPKILRSWEPMRYSASFLPDAVEAVHYLLKLAERAAAEGMTTVQKKRHGSKRADGDEDEDSLEAARERMREKAFQLEKYTAEFVHPTIIQAYTHCLAGWAVNGPKLNHFLVHFLRRVAALPNDFAGINPKTGKPLTYITMMYHTSVVLLAADILNTPVPTTGPGAAAVHEVRQWAKHFSMAFLRAVSENALLPCEALLWHSEKGANAELARHYGVLTGTASGTSGADGIHKKKSKAAIAADEAEAEARRNAAARALDAEEEEAQVDFDNLSDGSSRKRRKAGANKRGTGKGKRGKARRFRSDSGSDNSDSDSDSASDSSGSTSSSQSSRPRRRLRVQDDDEAGPQQHTHQVELDEDDAEWDDGLPGPSTRSMDWDEDLLADLPPLPALSASAAAGGAGAAAQALLMEQEAATMDADATATVAAPGAAVIDTSKVQALVQQFLADCAAASGEDEQVTQGGAGAANGSDADELQPSAAVSWLTALLKRCAHKRVQTEKQAATAGTAASAPGGASPGAFTLMSAQTKRSAAFPILASSSAQSKWMRMRSMQELLAAVGAVRRSGPGDQAGALEAYSEDEDDSWWEIPAAVPATVLQEVATSIATAQ